MLSSSNSSSLAQHIIIICIPLLGMGQLLVQLRYRNRRHTLRCRRLVYTVYLLGQLLFQYTCVPRLVLCGSCVYSVKNNCSECLSSDCTPALANNKSYNAPRTQRRLLPRFPISPQVNNRASHRNLLCFTGWGHGVRVSGYICTPILTRNYASFFVLLKRDPLIQIPINDVAHEM